MNLNGQQNQFINPNGSQNKRGGNGGLAGVLRYIPNVKLSMFLILVVQLIVFFLLLNPINIYRQFDVVKLINRVNEISNVPPAEVPVVNRIGDGNFPDLETILESNQINAEVFKDAKDGDYVLSYSTKMIIYRRSEDKLIYDNLSPNALVSQTQQTIATSVIAKAKSQGLIGQDSGEVPQLSLVTDANQVKSGDPAFYANLANNDVLATFGSKQLLVIYRPSTDTIINYGKVDASISSL